MLIVRLVLLSVAGESGRLRRREEGDSPPDSRQQLLFGLAYGIVVLTVLVG